MSDARRSVNLKELAEMLGLSQATVSLALGRSPETSGVARKTRERVQKAAEQLGYKPNFHARSLASGRSATIGILVPTISDGYYSSIIGGIEEYALECGYYFLIASHHWKKGLIEQLPGTLQSRGVEGLVVVNTLMPDLGIPSVRVGDQKCHVNSTSIYLNEEWGTKLALEYLFEKGHREICFLRGESESTATDARWNGILKAASALGIIVDAQRTIQLTLGEAKGSEYMGWIGYKAAQELIKRRTRFTALFAYNDATAIGAMRAFQDHGMRIPSDISVMGYDDIPGAPYERPALTTIRQPLFQMGRSAADILIRRLAGEPFADTRIVTPELIERDSVCSLSAARRSTSLRVRRKS